MLKRKMTASENGKNANDVAWLLYQDIVNAHSDKFEKPFDRYWIFRKCMESATLALDPETEMEKQALSNYVNKGNR
jgi:hypothetical protein